MPQPNVTLAREIAYDAFIEVMENRRTPEEALAELYATHEKALKRLDRNFIKEIVYGGLRWYSKILWILQNTASRNLQEVPAVIRAALVLGTYQIFYMDRVPDRAAVNESVEYVRKKGQSHAVSFVNGILRQIARRAEYFAKPDKATHPGDYLALQFAHPRWIVERWLRHFKFDRMETMLAANNQPPPYSVRINTLKTPTREIHTLQQALLRDERTHSERRPLRCTLRLKEPPRLDDESLFGKGYYTIQDEASQLVSFLVEPQEGQTIVDACAAPGGKLSHIYELAEGKVHLLAIDSNAMRLERAQGTMRRLGHVEGVDYLQADFASWKPEQNPDKVILDAPCSGLGVLRRHPEGKWLKEENLVSRMAAEQRKLLQHALGLVKEGGEVIYSVCSFEKEETEDHLRWLKSEFEDKIEIISPIARLPDFYKRYVTRDNLLLVYSGNPDDMDGFGAFVVRLKKSLETST